MEQEGTGLTASAKIFPARASVMLTIGREQLEAFFPMLQRGVSVQAELGCPLRELLSRQFGIPADYVEGRITTIFLDNRPVDDLDRSLIHEGSRVTLSAAMPGLVGATMRRSGFYATLRQGISHAESAGELGAGQGTVTLKLFNLLLPELGPLILARGVLLPRNELNRLFCGPDALSRNGLVASDRSERDDCGDLLLRVIIRE